MKTLLILRHGKSSWKFPDLPDHDRPLNSRGKRGAPLIGRKLAEEGMVPDVIISSSATRAHATAKKAAKASGYRGEIGVESSLYGGGHTTYLNILRNQLDQYEKVLLVGHNPDVEQLVDILTGTEIIMPTCALAHVSLILERWPDLNSNTKGKLVKIWRPKELIGEKDDRAT
jgi:phosphohistidine phosphatase